MLQPSTPTHKEFRLNNHGVKKLAWWFTIDLCTWIICSKVYMKIKYALIEDKYDLIK